MYGITLGDSSGIGPEVLLKAVHEKQIDQQIVVYGDIESLAYYNDALHLEVPLRRVERVGEYQPGFLNVLDFGLLARQEITPGVLNAKSGCAAREYVVGAARAALAGDIAAMVTLPMNKEATQMSDPAFVGHTELIGSVCGVSDVTIIAGFGCLDCYARDNSLLTYGSDSQNQATSHSDHPKDD